MLLRANTHLWRAFTTLLHTHYDASPGEVYIRLRAGIFLTSSMFYLVRCAGCRASKRVLPTCMHRARAVVPCREKEVREVRKRALGAAGFAVNETGDPELNTNSTNLYVSNIHRSVNEQARNTAGSPLALHSTVACFCGPLQCMHAPNKPVWIDQAQMYHDLQIEEEEELAVKPLRCVCRC